MRKPAVEARNLVVEFDAVGAGVTGTHHEAVDVHDVDLLAIYGSHQPSHSGMEKKAYLSVLQVMVEQ